MYPRRADRRQSRGKGDSAESREQVWSLGWCVGEYPPHCPLHGSGRAIEEKTALQRLPSAVPAGDFLADFCIGRILIWILEALT